MGNLFSDSSPIYNIVGNDNLLLGSSKPFGNNRNNVVRSDVEETIVKLRTAQETIDKRIDYVELQISHQISLAKREAAKGNKQNALRCLKRKRMFETNVTNMRGMHFNVEQQINSIETMQLNSFSFEAISDSAILLKSMNASMDVDVVQETMEEMKEHAIVADEIGGILATDYTNLNMDDSQLEKELQELIAESDVEDLNDTIFPSIPYASTTPAIVRNEPTLRQQYQQQSQTVSIENKSTNDGNKTLEEFATLYF
jgi:charged multivesicular body protein 4